MSDKRCMNCMKVIPDEAKKCPHCGFEEAYYQQEVYQLPVGHTLQNGRYQIGRVIGEGGFGMTYIGWDKKFSQVVAIKEFFEKGFVTRHNTVSFNVTPYKQSDKEQYSRQIKRVVSEATTIKQFANCPGIIRVEDYFEENNTVYIVMEYVEGMTLRQYIKENGSRITAAKCLKLFRPLIEALNEIHKQGMIHRDISLDNIIYQKDGTLKLLDFGSAREIRNETASVTVRYGYAPPEQYDGKNQGTWTDVYSLCVCLYNCLTGSQMEDSKLRSDETKLFSGNDSFSDLKKVQKEAIEKGLKLNYRERLQTIGELYYALYGEFINGSVRTDVHKESSVNYKKIGIGAGVACLAAAIGFAVWSGSNRSGQSDVENVWQTVTEQQQNESEAAEASGKTEKWEEDGTTYMGVKMDGKIEGNGTADYVDGSSYEGEFHKGLPEGNGTMLYKDGSRYEGEWTAGKKEGNGTIYYNEKEWYEGEWAAGKREGTGTMHYKDGSRYEGSWENNREHGAGVLYSDDGTSKSVVWKNGVLED